MGQYPTVLLSPPKYAQRKLILATLYTFFPLSLSCISILAFSNSK
jgi:hypothetical protein